MAAFIHGLMKMSVRGMVIILIVLCVRLLLKKMKVGHKYIVGLWTMAFLFFIVPWKISLPVGFWGNTTVLDEIWRNGEPEMGENSPGMGNAGNMDNAGNISSISNIDNADNGSRTDDAGNMGDGNYTGNADNMGNSGSIGSILDADTDAAGGSATQVQWTQGAPGVITTMPVGSADLNGAGVDDTQKDKPEQRDVEGILASLWLAGLFILLGHMLYSYLVLKRKLMLSVRYRDNIWWAENIDMPMVFGLTRPQIYLPITLEAENLSCVIAHEEMHVRRKDGLLKMAAYLICLLHWFNPFIWAAYLLFGSDLEKACDEEVIRRMEKEERKEYAYALVRIAAGKRKRKRRVFVAPIGFGEGNLKSRVKNVMKYKYMPLGIGAVVTAMIIALSALFLTEAKEPSGSSEAGALMGDNKAQGTSGEDIGENDAPGASGEPAPGDDEDTLPIFYVEDTDSLTIEDDWSIEDCYITNRRTTSNHYYIDEDGVLWGAGYNQYGQLGIGIYGIEEYREEPVKIAEHVVSVDASENGYFCIYLTEDGDLYGLGLNYAEVLLGKGSEVTKYNAEDYQRGIGPVLMMTNVVYMRAGRTCVVALQDTRSAYWWGVYSSTTLTRGGYFEDYWKLEDNPVKMFASEPVHIMNNCKYITTGTHTGAAISDEGELYTWGLNLFGQCGTPVTEDDYIRTPVKVMDGVKMAWVGRIGFDDVGSSVTDDAFFYVDWSTYYPDNTFILKEDNTLMAVGLNLGDKEKVTELTGDIWETKTHQYGDSFVPVRAVQYSLELSLQGLKNLDYGMSMEEAEEILNNSLESTFRFAHEDGEVGLCHLHNLYKCYFDGQGGLDRILIQEGTSRDGRFACGMSLSELQEAVDSAGGTLAEEADNEDGEYVYEDEGQRTRYLFHLYKGKLVTLWEIAMD